MNSVVDELVPVEIQKIRDGRPVTLIFEHKLAAEAHRYNYREIRLDVLASQVRILLDWADDLYCPQEEIIPNLMDQRILK